MLFTFTFTILRAFPLYEAYMLGYMITNCFFTTRALDQVNRVVMLWLTTSDFSFSKRSVVRGKKSSEKKIDFSAPRGTLGVRRT